MTGETSFPHILSRPFLRQLSPADPAVVLAALEQAGVPRLYPGLRSWFLGKVVPGLAHGERRIMTAGWQGALAGVAICKRGEVERKLCTLWIQPALRERGFAYELARDAFDWLDTSRPLFTVPEERFAEFSGLVSAWRFAGPYACPGLYRAGKIEYVYNGYPDGLAH